ncbi:Glycine cleavage system transcriptional activator [Cupriavidus yeoncheonensis]|uniref:Glycine cleavage system transcriptional activator n=1 Tax=Cupriavidus yeoncheonensis TaxID=1462994 RepID=A0A916IZC5_9BURK|nr:LysR substrate-binding domain-containing protein [Cupriavidus yeoncheonensis]CAG2157934.1 Glycine cleavage system transcriptional activator [Cupriavidus yeoncheonensis]
MTLLSQASANALRAISLDAIRGFESSARHLSFTAAAQELCLTQSAVSKQVKSLEDVLEVALFVRGGKGLALTAEGRQLYEAARAAIAQLGDAVDRLLSTERVSIAVTTTPSFASLWLVPKLARFTAIAPGIDVRVDASEANANLEREGFDLAIRLAPAAPDETPLLRERLMLVAAPAVAARVRDVADLVRQPLLVFHDPAGRFPWMSWPEWYARLGLAQSARQPCLYFSQYEHVLNAAAQGAGVAIGRTPLVLPLLGSGRLEVVLPQYVSDGMTYRIVESPNARSGVRRFREWLESELAAEVLGG